MAYSVYDYLDRKPLPKWPKLMHEDLPSGGHQNHWMTSDRKWFKDRNEAVEHQRKLDDV